MAKPPAASNFQQVRLTVSEDPAGFLVIRVLVKPFTESWQVKHSVYHHRVKRGKMSHHWTVTLAAALDVIMSETLPRSD